MAIKARWKGKSADDPDFEFVNHVPAKSLDEEEWDALDPELKEAVRKSPLYDVRVDHRSSRRRRDNDTVNDSDDDGVESTEEAITVAVEEDAAEQAP